MRLSSLRPLAFLFSGFLALGAAFQNLDEVTRSEDYYSIEFLGEKGCVPVEEFIELCRVVTGYSIKYSQAEVDGQYVLISGAHKVKRDKRSFFEYFQAVMASFEFVCTVHSPEENLQLVTVEKITPFRGKSDAARSQDHSVVRVIPRELLEDFKATPGVLITTTIPFENVNPKQVVSLLKRTLSNKNPKGPASGADRVSRGGSWYFSSYYLRCANRHYYNPVYRGDHYGFRLALD